MKQFSEQFKTEAAQIKLTTSERDVLRARLRQEMAATPVVPASRDMTPSPYRFFFALDRAWGVRILAGVLLLVFVAGGGAGTTYAAASALPGQWLYPVKIYVNESVQAALATTPLAKAQVHASLAELRVEEAQTLASEGKLTASTTAELQANFDEHATQVQSLTTALAATDPGAAAQIGAQLASSLQANNAVLVRLGDRSTDPETKRNSAAFALRTQFHTKEPAPVAVAAAKAATSSAGGSAASTTVVAVAYSARSAATSSDSASARMQWHGKTAASTTTSTQAVALGLQARAASELAAAQQQFGAQSSSLDDDTRTQLEAALASTTVMLSEGSSALDASDVVVASSRFMEALRKAVEIQAYLRAGKNFNNNLIVPLLDTPGDPSDQ